MYSSSPLTLLSSSFGLTLLSLLAFAANSYLCRWALQGSSIDPSSFSFLRLSSGFLALCLLGYWRRQRTGERINVATCGSWLAAIALLAYVACFSYAYVYLNTGTGALVLFTAVQISMQAYGWWSGYRPSGLQWLGTLLAFAGFIYLIWPQLGQPSLLGFMLMLIAGIAWGAYSIIGQSSQAPLFDTLGNFGRASLLGLPLLMLNSPQLEIQSNGFVLAVASGALGSGCAYALWYYVLPRLGNSIAAVLQLSVPVFAALAGVLFLAEEVSLRFVIASASIFMGILLVLKAKL